MCLLFSTGELMILIVGLHYGFSARNARVQFEERRYLFYAIVAETMFSFIFYTLRTFYPIPFNTDLAFAATFLRGLLTNTFTLIIIFVPKVCIYVKEKNKLINKSVQSNPKRTYFYVKMN